MNVIAHIFSLLPPSVSLITPKAKVSTLHPNSSDVACFKKNLAFLANHYGIALNHHDALSDARACAALYAMHLKNSH